MRRWLSATLVPMCLLGLTERQTSKETLPITIDASKIMTIAPPSKTVKYYTPEAGATIWIAGSQGRRIDVDETKEQIDEAMKNTCGYKVFPVGQAK